MNINDFYKTIDLHPVEKASIVSNLKDLLPLLVADGYKLHPFIRENFLHFKPAEDGIYLMESTNIATLTRVVLHSYKDGCIYGPQMMWDETGKLCSAYITKGHPDKVGDLKVDLPFSNLVSSIYRGGDPNQKSPKEPNISLEKAFPIFSAATKAKEMENKIMEVLQDVPWQESIVDGGKFRHKTIADIQYYEREAEDSRYINITDKSKHQKTFRQTENSLGTQIVYNDGTQQARIEIGSGKEFLTLHTIQIKTGYEVIFKCWPDGSPRCDITYLKNNLLTRKVWDRPSGGKPACSEDYRKKETTKKKTKKAPKLN